MSHAISIHIGLNRVDPNQYNGWDGQLKGCINDANAIKRVAESLGYSPVIQLLDDKATADRVIGEIGQAALNLDANGILLLTFSGHGGQIDDVNGDEPDGQDETLVLYDRQLIDDELTNLWSQFSSGQRIVVLSDSCHSGTVTRAHEYLELAKTPSMVRHYRTRSGAPRFRAIPTQVGAANYQHNKLKYDALQFAAGGRSKIDACVLLISGCQDNQESSDGDTNGLFTGTLLQVWANGAFSGNYASFHQAILENMPPTQTPNYFIVGAENPGFEAQKPFTIGEIRVQTNGDPSGPWPFIKGPASTTRSASPTFQVNAGPGRFFVTEVATRPDLFDITNHKRERNRTNFYGSWDEFPPMRGTSYTLPHAEWQNLCRADRLYYRIGSTTNPDGFDNYLVSSLDHAGDAIPSIVING